MPVTLYHGPAGSGKSDRILSDIERRYLQDGRLDGFCLTTETPASVDLFQKKLLGRSPNGGLFLGESILTFGDFLLKLLKFNIPRVHTASRRLSRNVIRRLLTEKHYPALEPLKNYSGIVQELSTSILLLKKNGLDPDRARALLSRFLTPGLEGLFGLFKDYQGALREIGYFDEGDRALETLTRLRERTLALPAGLKTLYLDRLFPISLGQREIIRELAHAHPHLEIVLSYSFDYRSEEDPYFYPAYGFMGEIAQTNEYFESKGESPALTLSSFSDAGLETEWIAQTIHRRIQSGTPPSSIGVILPRAPFYHGRLTELLTKRGIPSHPAPPVSLSENSAFDSEDGLDRMIAHFLKDRLPPLRESLGSLAEIQNFEEEWSFEKELVFGKKFDGPLLEKWKDEELRRASFTPRVARDGVRLMTLADAANGEFDALFIAGYAESQYPGPLGEHPFYTPEMLLEPALREILEGPAYRLSRERHLMAQALLRTKAEVYFTYPKLFWDGKEQFASKLLQIEGGFIPSEPDRRAAVPPPKPPQNNAFPGAHQNRFSISEIETYLKCPYQYYARYQLKLGDRDRDETDVPPDKRGNFVHRVLDRLLKENLNLYQEAVEYDLYLKRLIEKAAELIDDEKTNDAFLLQAPEAIREAFCGRVRRVLAEYLKNEILHVREGKKKTRPLYFEWAFGRGKIPPLVIKGDKGKDIHLSGRIDRIDVNEDLKLFTVIDYKTGRLDTMTQLKKGESLQIPVYLTAISRLLLKGYKPAAGILLGLNELEHSTTIGIEPYADAESAPKRCRITEEEWGELEAKVEGVIRDAASKIQRGYFEPKPKSASLCRVCDYAAVCHFTAGTEEE